MAASTITRDTWVDGAAGTDINNSVLQNHIYARIDAMFAGAGAYSTFALGGRIAIEGFGTHTFSAGGAGGNTLAVRNTSAGTGNFGRLSVGNDSDADLASVVVFASSFATSGPNVANGASLGVAGGGGLSVLAAHGSGQIRFYSGGVAERARLTAAGNFHIGTSVDAPSSARRVQIIGVGEGTPITDAGSKAATLLIASDGGSANDGGSVEFGFGHGSYGQSYFAAIKGLGDNGGNNTTGDLVVCGRRVPTDTALTETLRVTSAGNLYVGTTTAAPSSARKVQIVGTSQAGAPSDAGDKSSVLLISSSDSGVGDGGSIEFGCAGTQSYFAAIKSLTTSASFNTLGDVVVFTRRVATDAALTESLRVSSSGAIYERARTIPMGVWTSVSYGGGGGHFSTDSGTWTVDSADQLGFEYMVIGDTMCVALCVAATSLASVGNELRVLIPGGFTARTKEFTGFVAASGTTAEPAIVTTLDGATGGANKLSIQRLPLAAWPNSTNAQGIRFEITFTINL